MDQWEQLAAKELLVLMAFQASKEILDLKVFRVQLVPLVPVATKALKDQRVRSVW